MKQPPHWTQKIKRLCKKGSICFFNNKKQVRSLLLTDFQRLCAVINSLFSNLSNHSRQAKAKSSALHILSKNSLNTRLRSANSQNWRVSVQQLKTSSTQYLGAFSFDFN